MAHHQPRASPANSIDGIFVIPDELATPPGPLDYIPPELEFPPEAIQGVIHNVFDYTASYLSPRGIDLGGRVSPLALSERQSPPGTPTPMPGQVASRRRRRRDSSLGAPNPKRVAFGPANHTSPRSQSLAPMSRHTALERLEVKLVRSHFTETSDLSPIGQHVTLTQELFQSFNNGEKMFVALQLLATVSSTQDSPAEAFNVPTTTPFSSLTTTTGPATMIEASRAAQKYIQRSEILPGLVRLQLLMSYMTLYLTIEKVIVPQLRLENPTWTEKRIAGEKYDFFYNVLNESNTEGGSADLPMAKISRAPRKFRVDVGFGKVFWTLLQDLGVTALLGLAVSDLGLTTIARAMGPDSPQRQALRVALWASRGWWSFAHAIGPPTLRTFFGPRDISYTVPELLHKLRIEPLPTSSIELINRSCGTKGIKIGPATATNEAFPIPWTLKIGDTFVPISHHPSPIPVQGVQHGNIWEWMEGDRRSQLIFDFLHPSGDKDPGEALEFFCKFYNRRALPARLAVPFWKLPTLPEDAPELSFEERVDALVDKEPGAASLELLALPVKVDQWILTAILDFHSKCATIHNWAEEAVGMKLMEVRI